MPLFLLTIASLLSRFWNLSFPARVIFDESHFGLYATKYLSGQYYFDIHPPLGKMILGFFAWVGGAVPGFDFAPGASYGDFPYFFLRFAPALFGSLLVPFAYLIARQLGFSQKTSFLVGAFILLDNAFLLQSRLALLDTIMIFFVALALLFFLKVLSLEESSQKRTSLLMCGLALGLAGSVKWVGFGALALFWAYLLFQRGLQEESSRKQVPYLIFLLLVPFVVYASVFFLHMSLASDPCTKECGQVLEKSSSGEFKIFNIPPSGNIAERFAIQHAYMTFGTLGADKYENGISSQWYAWPLMYKGFFYHVFKQEDGKISALFFSGNPVVWYMSGLGLLGILSVLTSGFKKKLASELFPGFSYDKLLLLLLGYAVFLVSFATIQRNTALYHYLISLFFAVLIFGAFFEWVLTKVSKNKKRFLYVYVLLLVFLGFLYVAPLSYGIPLTEEQRDTRINILSWPKVFFRYPEQILFTPLQNRV